MRCLSIECLTFCDILGSRSIQKFLKLFTVFDFSNNPRFSVIPRMLLYFGFFFIELWLSASKTGREKKKLSKNQLFEP